MMLAGIYTKIKVPKWRDLISATLCIDGGTKLRPHSVLLQYVSMQKESV